MKKHLIVGAILTGAWAATLFLIPNGAAADLQMPGGHTPDNAGGITAGQSNEC